MDKLGGPDTYGHFPTGWAVAFSTPFQMFKRYSQYSGGTSDPLVISWPKGIKARGEIRNQYHHSVGHRADDPRHRRPRDAEGLPRRRAVPALRRLDAIHLRRGARTHRRRRSASSTRCSAPVGCGRTAGSAAAVHAPFTGKGHFDQDQWQLYHVDDDRSESTDLAKQVSGEAGGARRRRGTRRPGINLALPMDDRTAVRTS